MATKTIVKYRTRTAKRARRRKGFTLPIAVLGGFAPLAYAGYLGFQGLSTHADVASVPGVVGMVKQVGFRLTGYSPDTKKWYPGELAQGVAPIVAGMLVHKLANRVGINRALSSAGVPILRI